MYSTSSSLFHQMIITPTSNDVKRLGWSFLEDEINFLLDFIEELHPIGPNEWDQVTEHHYSYYPGLGQTSKSIQRKFALLCNNKNQQETQIVLPTFVEQSKSGN